MPEDHLRQLAGLGNDLGTGSPGCLFELFGLDQVRSFEVENSLGRIEANDGKERRERFDEMGRIGSKWIKVILRNEEEAVWNVEQFEQQQRSVDLREFV